MISFNFSIDLWISRIKGFLPGDDYQSPLQVIVIQSLFINQWSFFTISSSCIF